MLHAIREVQIPLLAALLLGGCATKLRRALRTGSVDEGLGPTALFPMRLRRPMAISVCAIEGGLGLGLILTAGHCIWPEALATTVRAGTGLLFAVATLALIELRQSHPDAGCGCFGDFSTAPVSGRTLARSALLTAAAMATIWLQPITHLPDARVALGTLGVFCAELLVIGALSPEVSEALIRLGYTEPCEVRNVPAARTLTVLRRSRPWRRYAGLITLDAPVDVWRELCWRYVVYPASNLDQPAEIVFAVFLQQRRPAVRAALVDGVTGLPVPWPTPEKGSIRSLLPSRRPALRLPAPQADLPISSDL
ncbi:MAG TPA: MauE/DoxX family redox-associated membrane protein [Streptosporangiaceae bacterium]|nr:MauE/DoxX family redox-associated membrane protein [Streptosporangiaceae bacterium]